MSVRRRAGVAGRDVAACTFAVRGIERLVVGKEGCVSDRFLHGELEIAVQGQGERSTTPLGRALLALVLALLVFQVVTGSAVGPFSLGRAVAAPMVLFVGVLLVSSFLTERTKQRCRPVIGSMMLASFAAAISLSIVVR